ncbi:MAG TPA: stress responsive protein [Spirochaeta sp.]|nr:stress responsive protein [Spirochaeta sp.]
MISHNVFFELKNDSEEAVSKLISECHKYLKPIEGIIYFIAGSMHEEHDRDVNVRDYHVATHVTFRNQEAHDKYQIHPLHNEFAERNKDNWKSVRVFDWLPDYNC